MYYQFIPIEKELIEGKYDVFPTGKNLIQNKQIEKKTKKILNICALVIPVMLILNFIIHSPVKVFSFSKINFIFHSN